MKQTTKRMVGVSRLLKRLSKGQATLSDRAWTFSPLAWPLSRFLSALRDRFVTMRQASIDISLNTARLLAQTLACRDMAREQAAESQGLATRGAQIAAMSEQTSASVGEIASTFHDQMAVAAAAGRQIKGYVFYHQQDTQFAADGSGICLTYGGYIPATQEDEDDRRDENDGKEEDEWEDVDEEADKVVRASAAVAIGRRVVSALKVAGLKVKWNGNLNKRIEVRLDWRRRRATLAQRPATSEAVPAARAA